MRKMTWQYNTNYSSYWVKKTTITFLLINNEKMTAVANAVFKKTTV